VPVAWRAGGETVLFEGVSASLDLRARRSGALGALVFSAHPAPPARPALVVGVFAPEQRPPQI
jgi:hypothetical protein